MKWGCGKGQIILMGPRDLALGQRICICQDVKNKLSGNDGWFPVFFPPDLPWAICSHPAILVLSSPCLGGHRLEGPYLLGIGPTKSHCGKGKQQRTVSCLLIQESSQAGFVPCSLLLKPAEFSCTPSNN